MPKKLPSIASAFIFTFIIIFWQTYVNIFRIPEWILPGPYKIVLTLWEQRTTLFFHAIPTLFEALIGLFIAILIGIVVSICMKASRLFKDTMYPILILSQAVPFIALAPLLAMWLGFGFEPKIILIALVCFFPIAITLFEGFGSVDRNMERFMIALGATKWQRFRYLLFPASLPSFFSGLKVAATYSILTAVVSEWIGTDRGLGIFLVRSAKSFLVDRVFATVVLISILSIVVVRLVDVAARVVMPWYFRAEIRKEKI